MLAVNCIALFKDINLGKPVFLYLSNISPKVESASTTFASTCSLDRRERDHKVFPIQSTKNSGFNARLDDIMDDGIVDDANEDNTSNLETNSTTRELYY